jgi:RNA polymerase subunit RPABC4/transcription elongation factor Spt4
MDYCTNCDAQMIHLDNEDVCPICDYSTAPDEYDDSPSVIDNEEMQADVQKPHWKGTPLGDIMNMLYK